MANDRTILSSERERERERETHINKPAYCQTVIKSGLKPQMGALFEDRRAD
jgi:hypothetical protein